MSRVLIQRLATVQQEFESARAALSYVERQWSEAADDAGLKGVSHSQIIATLRRLEQTSLTRLFSEFEDILRTYLESRAEVVPSKAFDLIEGREPTPGESAGREAECGASSPGLPKRHCPCTRKRRCRRQLSPGAFRLKSVPRFSA